MVVYYWWYGVLLHFAQLRERWTAILLTPLLYLTLRPLLLQSIIILTKIIKISGSPFLILRGRTTSADATSIHRFIPPPPPSPTVIVIVIIIIITNFSIMMMIITNFFMMMTTRVLRTSSTLLASSSTSLTSLKSNSP